jgi:hypothetical protein
MAAPGQALGERTEAMKKTVVRAALAALFASALAGSARAQHEHGRGAEHREAHPAPAHIDPHWRGDIHGFREHDLGYWGTGRWYHGYHGGRFGWWWIVGPTWYIYPAPVYPYPNPYIPPTIAPAAAPSWYWCPNPAGYYPYVATCSVPWQPVPMPPQ